MTTPVRHRLMVLAVIACTVAQLAVSGMATASSPLTLRHAQQSARWTGHFGAAGAGVSRPEMCAANDCDEVLLDVDLPPQAWNRDGGLQVGVRWPDEEQDLDLFVYGPDGELTAQSDGFMASVSESVLVPRPRNGRYRIVVVPRLTEDLAYEGVAQIERAPRTQPVRDMLPDLVALPARHATFTAGAYFLSHPSPLVGGCYPEEMVEDGARRCLRFDQILANVGAGPFELRYDMQAVATDQRLLQRVYRSDGSWWERPADSYEFHATHAHFHYKNFAVTRLWASDATGQRLGGEPVRVGKKNGFCVQDIDNVWFGRHGDGARSYYFPQCLAPTENDASGFAMRQGMSVGWADVYNWFLADQYIETSGVPDGYYLLETRADADEKVVETNEGNNVSFTHIRICGDAAEIVGTPPSCP